MYSLNHVLCTALTPNCCLSFRMQFQMSAPWFLGHSGAPILFCSASWLVSTPLRFVPIVPWVRLVLECDVQKVVVKMAVCLGLSTVFINDGSKVSKLLCSHYQDPMNSILLLFHLSSEQMANKIFARN